MAMTLKHPGIKTTLYPLEYRECIPAGVLVREGFESDILYRCNF